MNGIDFNNAKGSNLGDPKFGQDATNLRTVKTLISNSFLNLSAITAPTITTNNLLAYSANTNTLTAFTISLQQLKFAQPSIQPAPASGLMWFSANTLYIYTGNTYSDLKKL